MIALHLLSLLLTLDSRACRRSWLLNGERYGISTWYIGSACGPGGEILRWSTPSNSQEDFLLRSWAQWAETVPLMPFDSLICLVPPQYMGYCRRIMGVSSCFLYNWNSLVATHHSPFPLLDRLPWSGKSVTRAAGPTTGPQVGDEARFSGPRAALPFSSSTATTLAGSMGSALVAAESLALSCLSYCLNMSIFRCISVLSRESFIGLQMTTRYTFKRRYKRVVSLWHDADIISNSVNISHKLIERIPHLLYPIIFPITYL